MGTYYDQQHQDLLEFDFLLDFDRTVALGHTDANHNSAINFSSNVDKYIKKELKHSAILGLFNQLPINS